jgi:transcription factor SPN1
MSDIPVDDALLNPDGLDELPINEDGNRFTEAKNAAMESDNESLLSDLDIADFEDYNDPNGQDEVVIPIDNDTVHAIGKFKKKRTEGDRPKEKKDKRRRDKRRRGSDEEMEEARVQEVELTEEQSKWCSFFYAAGWKPAASVSLGA